MTEEASKIFQLKKEMKKLTKGNQRLKMELEVMTECAEDFEKAVEIYQTALKAIKEASGEPSSYSVAEHALKAVNEIMWDFSGPSDQER